MSQKVSFPCRDVLNNEISVDLIEQIYNHLGDDISREIFGLRLMFSLTEDYQFIRKLVWLTEAGKKFEKFLMDTREVPLYIYGAGIMGTRLPNIYKEANWVGYIDKYKMGQCNGLPIWGISQCEKIEEGGVIVISNFTNVVEIGEELIKRGVPEKQITSLRHFAKMTHENIYFDREVLGSESMEGLLIDAGCYDGEDTIHYLDYGIHNAVQVMAFEPDDGNYKICEDRLRHYPNVSLYNIGLSDEEKACKFKMLHADSSKFSEEGDTEVQTMPLDKLVGENRVGFIKMDIEGYEKKALSGAKKTIERDKPICAISIYHTKDDIWNIPKMLLEYNPQYKLYLRHYSLEVTDTIVYAI